MKKRKVSLFLLLAVVIGMILKSNVYAEEANEKYSIDSLLRNYNVVTLGHHENILPDYYYSTMQGLKKGDLAGAGNISGAILVNGDFMPGGDSATFGEDAGNVKSFIKGEMFGNVTTTSQLITDSNEIDFNQMYKQVVIESEALANQSTKEINSAKIEISSPGNYTIKNTSVYWDESQNYYSRDNNTILIKNYDKDNNYIFNYYNEYINFLRLPSIKIMENGSSVSVPLNDYAESGNFAGNIIFNFPNAKVILIDYGYSKYNGVSIGYTKSVGFSGHIIAPKADILFESNYKKEEHDPFRELHYYYGTIISNKIGMHRAVSNIKSTKYTPTKKILNENNSQYIKEAKNYEDDLYTRDYSIKDLLQNYSLITLGNKEIDSKSKLLEYGNTPGSIKMFHITGQALIAGDLYSKTYENELDDFYTLPGGNWHVNVQKYDKTAFDLESNKVTESYIKGNIGKNVSIDTLSVTGNTNNSNQRMPISVIQPWDNMSSDTVNYVGQKNSLFVGPQEEPFLQYEYLRGSAGDGNYSGYVTNYINFDRLYENVVTEQAAIKEGKLLKVGEDGTVHIPIGGSYTIEDISKVKEVIFDNFDKEKDELTIVTVKNSGDINFPLISKDTGSYKGIVTNDYYGKEQATHLYEQDTFVEDSYHGNIIWNVPNATYIKLKENAPFAGHLIAPKADVDTPETHFAGCFIVNSIYGEGNTEAHFYPVTATLKCDCEGYDNLDEGMKMKFSEYRLSKLLGGDASTIETEILGDETQYREDNTTLENVYNECPSNSSASSISNNPIVSILTNPKTYRNLGLIIILGGLMTYTIINKKKQKIEK